MGIYQSNHKFLYRLNWLRGLFLLSFLLLFAQLWHLMILKSVHYQELAERNRVRTVPLLAPRGLVYDREGRVLIDNTRAFNLGLYLEEAKDLDDTLEFLSAGLQLDHKTVLTRLEKARHYAAYQPVILKENIPIQETSYVLSHQAEHPELRIFEQPRRIYRYGQLAAHALGYVGEVSGGPLEHGEFPASNPGDIVGKFGIERSYNQQLTGQDGQRRLLVNSLGETIQTLERFEPVTGKDIQLTLDLDLQMVAESELAGSPGAIVALDPRNGEILVMASRPAFDPNDFAKHISREQWERLTEDPDTPFQNRVIQSTFPPGSVFKIVIALAGLQYQAIDPADTASCKGGAVFHGSLFSCWKPGGHGVVPLREAIRQSCNVYFYRLGQKLGIDQISEFSRKLGLGHPTGIDLPGEALGLVPSREWKRAHSGEPWYAGETISVAIGQGPINVTPIQLVRLVGIVATGKSPSLSLIQGQEPARFGKFRPLPDPELSSQNLQAVRDAMWSVVNEWGTGRAARVAGFDVCGKTGTAQTIRRATRAKLSAEQAEKFESNAWFVAFAPRENPEIVVAVIVQRGGAGGSAAAPIAREILARYYEKRKTAPPKATEVAFYRKEPIPDTVHGL